MSHATRSMALVLCGVLVGGLTAGVPAAHAAGKLAYVDIANVFDN